MAFHFTPIGEKSFTVEARKVQHKALPHPIETYEVKSRGLAAFDTVQAAEDAAKAAGLQHWHIHDAASGAIVRSRMPVDSAPVST